MSTLDKERSLAEQSASMFNKIKEENKREAEERIKTLEQQLNREQNNRLLEKNTLDSTHSRTIGEFDRRFREKMHELNEALNKTRH
jgi:phenylalanyl-tRNA synthetase alpha subunit